LISVIIIDSNHDVLLHRPKDDLQNIISQTHRASTGQANVMKVVQCQWHYSTPQAISC